MSFKISTANQLQIHFDFTNNYLVIAANANLYFYYRKPYLTTLKVVFYNLSTDPRIPTGIDLLQEYELDYVGDYEEYRTTYDANNKQIENETINSYGSTLNPVITGTNVFQRFKFVDTGIILTNPDNLTFNIKLIETNRKANPLYRWDSTNSNYLEWVQPPASPDYLDTADSVGWEYNYYGHFGRGPNTVWKHWNLAYTSLTIPASVQVTLSGFMHPNNLHFNGTTHTMFSIQQWFGGKTYGYVGPTEESWPSFGTDTFTVDSFPYGVLYYNLTTGSSIEYLQLVGFLSWDGTFAFKAIASGSTTPPYFEKIPINTITPIDVMHPLTDIFIDFNDAAKIKYEKGNNVYKSKVSTLANTTVLLQYNSEYRRWISEPLESNGYPFRLEINNCYTENLFYNLDPQKDIYGYYGSSYNFVYDGNTYNSNTMPICFAGPNVSIYEENNSLYTHCHRPPLMLAARPADLSAFNTSNGYYNGNATSLSLKGTLNRSDFETNPSGPAILNSTINYYAWQGVNFASVMPATIQIGEPGNLYLYNKIFPYNRVFLTGIKKIYQVY